MAFVLKDIILLPLGEEPRGIEGMSGSHWMYIFALIETHMDGKVVVLLFSDGSWAPLKRFCTNMMRLRQWLTKRKMRGSQGRCGAEKRALDTVEEMS